MTESIAVWDWEREPVPDARVVVCRPGLFDGDDVERKKRQHTVCFPVPLGERTVVASMRLPGGGWMPGIIPSLYVERQADLARLPDLLAVKAERRALVLCPREAIDLRRVNDGSWYDREGADFYDALIGSAYWANGDHGLGGGPHVDLVVIIPPPEARTCPTCEDCGPVKAYVKNVLQYVPCPECGGKGTIEPWSMSAAWVRGIVEQCRAAGVPVICLTEHLGAEVQVMPEWLS